MIRTPQQEFLARHVAEVLAGRATPARDATGAPVPLTDDDRAALREIEARAGLRAGE